MTVGGGGAGTSLAGITRNPALIYFYFVRFMYLIFINK
jgi:hypothetical protein